MWSTKANSWKALCLSSLPLSSKVMFLKKGTERYSSLFSITWFSGAKTKNPDKRIVLGDLTTTSLDFYVRHTMVINIVTS